MPSAFLTLSLVALGVFYCLWKVIKPYVVKGCLSGLRGPARDSWWLGNFHQIYDLQAWDFHDDLVKEYGSAAKVHGLFGDEQLYVSDPRALHHILIKDQNVFEEMPATLAFGGATFGMGLLSTVGAQHKKQRKMLNPVFSIRHMRGLVDVFYPIVNNMRDLVKEQVKDGEVEINMMDWMSRTALECIGQGGMGYSFDALDMKKTNKYAEAVRSFIPTAAELGLPRAAFHHMVKLGPAWFRRKLVEMLPLKPVQQMKYVVDTMHETSVEIFEHKKEALRLGEESVVKQVGRGKDIMSILLRANLDVEDDEKLPEVELLGQMNTMIFAGFDTTTSATSTMLWVLAQNPDMQERIRNEVRAARNAAELKTGVPDLDYDTLIGLPYMDGFIRETFRLYPPITTWTRVALQDTVLPLLRPIQGKNGQSIDQIHMKKDTGLIMSIVEANKSKETWGEDAELFRPERWLGTMYHEDIEVNLNSDEKGKEKPTYGIAKEYLPGVYSGMMSFLGGSRACIGFKFAELESKLIISILLDTFRFAPSREIKWNMPGLRSATVKGSEDTTPQLPLKVYLA